MRVKIKFTEPLIFRTMIKVRITDINYGGHVGNDSILGILHEVRLQFLNQWHYTEMNAGGCGLIMADSAIQYKAESFHGDDIEAGISIENITSVSFDILYRLQTMRDGRTIDIAFAKTGMVTYDYTTRTVVPLPQELKNKLHAQSD